MKRGASNPTTILKRRWEVATLLEEDYSIEEIAEESGYSQRTIQRDIQYIQSHRNYFFS